MANVTFGSCPRRAAFGPATGDPRPWARPGPRAPMSVGQEGMQSRIALTETRFRALSERNRGHGDQAIDIAEEGDDTHVRPYSPR